jgi:hypothetical protein
MEREPAVAGQFYEHSEAELRKEIEDCFLNKKFGAGKLPVVSENKDAERKIIGLVVPHAGYMYSGPIAANSYFHLANDGKPETFIIIGPNHSGFGSSVSIMDEGVWKTPLGKISIDSEVAKRIIASSKIVKEDVAAHIYEHSIEVQLPFLQYVYKKFQFVPICMLDQSYEVCEDLGNSIAKSVESKNAVIVASSDFTHFETNESAHKQDKKALDAIKKMDAEKFLDVVARENISICGYGPIATMLVAVEKLNAKSCEIIKYATSGDITENDASVVGYAAVKVMK